MFEYPPHTPPWAVYHVTLVLEWVLEITSPAPHSIHEEAERESCAPNHTARWLDCGLSPSAASYQLCHLSPKPFLLKMGIMMYTCLLTKQVP